MAFAENQLKLLDGKLPEKHVKTRIQRGMTLSYIEAWHAIAEANRIFGFDGWDRETIQADCVWQDGRGATKLCAYTARVRIRVRAGDTVIQRDGSGVGQGSGATLGEAHESALKEAETDATKRALITFGNLFGLALYDREQAGVRRAPRPRDQGSPPEPSERWTVLGAGGERRSEHEGPEEFCTALKRAIDEAVLLPDLDSIRSQNMAMVERLRLTRPGLKTEQGVHYADLLERYLARARQRLLDLRGEPQLIVPVIDKSALALGAPKRLRDAAHIKFIDAQPCLICGRSPSQAHHLRFAQPRAMSNKVSDEWTVPLCFTHHRALHTVGNEEAWWAEKGIDAKAEALRLWDVSHGALDSAEANTTPPTTIASKGPVHSAGSASAEAPTGLAEPTGAPGREPPRDESAVDRIAALDRVLQEMAPTEFVRGTFGPERRADAESSGDASSSALSPDLG
jgi:hypothetical protein